VPENLKEEDHLEDLDVAGRIYQKYVKINKVQ
jgi:hypothetical protein